MQSQASRAAGDDSYLALQREEVLEVIELDVCFGRHDGLFVRYDLSIDRGMPKKEEGMNRQTYRPILQRFSSVIDGEVEVRR